MKIHFSLVKKFEGIINKTEIINTTEKIEITLTMLIHAADLSGSARQLELATKWSSLIA